MTRTSKLAPKLSVAALGVGLFVGLRAPAFAAAEQSAGTAPPVPAASPAPGARQASPWLTVTSAADIVGRTLRDPHGNEAGRVEGLVLDVESGVVLYALVGSAGSFDIGQDYAAVPFPAMTVHRGLASVTVGVEAERIAKAPRVAAAHLSELGEADRFGSLYGQYGIPTPQGYVFPPSDERAKRPDRFVLVRPGQIAPLSVPRELARDVRGANVEIAGGGLVGEIERVMIDTGAMRVAYLLVSHGGFLGFDEKWLAIPFQALDWSAADHAYVLDAGRAPLLKQLPDLPKGEAPIRIRRNQLEDLYRRFGVKPYWQQG